MAGKRRVCGAAFQAKVALAAAKDDRTTAQVAELFADGWQAERSLGRHFIFCHERPHQALGYRTPSVVYAER